jgi:hypothetical protein
MRIMTPLMMPVMVATLSRTGRSRSMLVMSGDGGADGGLPWRRSSVS